MDLKFRDLPIAVGDAHDGLRVSDVYRHGVLARAAGVVVDTIIDLALAAGTTEGSIDVHKGVGLWRGNQMGIRATPAREAVIEVQGAAHAAGLTTPLAVVDVARPELHMR